MTNMTKHPGPKAGSILMETEHGLSVWRPLKSLKTSILPAESLDEFTSLLDHYVAFGDREDFVRHYWTKAIMGSPISDEMLMFRAKAIEAGDDRKTARRNLIGYLKKIRAAPAKNLDDILFKAELCAVLEPYAVEYRRTLPHSIIDDLLSAGCTWMQPSAENTEAT
jgi:hypothetical protein